MSIYSVTPGIPQFSSSGKEVGEVTNGCLQKHVRFYRHLYRKLDGWTWDKAIIEKAISLGAKSVIVFDDEKHLAYKVSMEDFVRLATPIHHPGYGEQLCLPRAFWQVTEIPKRDKKRGRRTSI